MPARKKSTETTEATPDTSTPTGVDRPKELQEAIDLVVKLYNERGKVPLIKPTRTEQVWNKRLQDFEYFEVIDEDEPEQPKSTQMKLYQ